MIDIISFFIISICIGIVFGFALEKSKVYLPSSIIGQMNFTNFVMVRVFFTAIAVGMFIVALLLSLSVSVDFTSYAYSRSIVGGGIMGIGVALAGACPGTVIVQLSAGYKKAMITILGAFSGALLYALYEYKILLYLGTEKCSYKSLYNFVSGKIILGFLTVVIIGIILYRAFNNNIKKS
jgi:hypothetical protein